jgi:hypothetical protein
LEIIGEAANALSEEQKAMWPARLLARLGVFSTRSSERTGSWWLAVQELTW